MLNFSGISYKGFLGKLLRFPLRFIPATTVVPILQGPLRGKRWIVGSSTHGCWLGSYESVKQKEFAKVIQPGMIVYDVGAHVGFYTLLASYKVGSSGSVVVFEPLPRNIYHLRRHLALNDCANVTVKELAVSNYNGTAWFSTQAGHSSERYLDDTGQFKVQVITLDDLWKGGAPMPDVIKMDIDGAEYLALLGAQQLLTRRYPIIFLATHSPNRASTVLRLAAGDRLFAECFR